MATECFYWTANANATWATLVQDVSMGPVNVRRIVPTMGYANEIHNVFVKKATTVLTARRYCDVLEIVATTATAREKIPQRHVSARMVGLANLVFSALTWCVVTQLTVRKNFSFFQVNRVRKTLLARR